MSRILGIDYGLKRIGLALSDPLGIFASGLDTLDNRSQKQVLRELQALIQTHHIERIVIGVPIRSRGEPGTLATEIQDFGAALQQMTGIAVVYEDERFSSVIAQQSLKAQGVKPSRQKHLVDKTAAALILQQYLDKAKNALEP